MKTFGNALRDIRRKRQETLAEVSGAVEIDVSKLGDIESGSVQPSEEIVLLLISHFSLREDEAVKLWKLAGYDQSQFGIVVEDNQVDSMSYTPPADSRILYTDMVHVSANNYGVVINFLQGLGENSKPSSVARIGMSREHAKSVIDVLQRTLQLAENVNGPKLPKQLNSPEDRNV